MKITLAQIADAKELAELAASNNYSAHWSPSAFTSELGLPAAKIYKATNTSTNIIVGFVAFRLSPPQAELTNLVVQKTSLRQGVAAKLLAFAFEDLKANKVKEITLEVNVNNKPALNLYGKFAFKTVNIRKNFYNKEDAALMLKQI
ncbi:MAG: GNAT family N-acetyltransferase [Elusimicrobiota bacterium]|jgi:ribosomal-protein-alanine N-acetyltransferase|nr:GNAT family N-acetyltransferase [Elusimicrobiota bacterium]